MHLAEYRQKQENNGWFGKNSKLAWLTGTQLCPIIWLVGIFLMALYAHKVSLQPPCHGYHVLMEMD